MHGPYHVARIFIVDDQLLWFGMMMNHYLIHPNKVRAFNIPVYDKKFDATFFGIEADEAFTPFTSKGTVISFELRVRTYHSFLVQGTDGIL